MAPSTSKPGVAPGAFDVYRARGALAIVLLLRCMALALAAVLVVLDVAPGMRAVQWLVLGAIGAHQTAVAWYVIRYRMRGRTIPFVAQTIPHADAANISLAWLAVGDPGSPLMLGYFCLIVGYSGRFAGRRFVLMALPILVQAVAVHLILEIRAGASALTFDTIALAFAGGTLVTVAHLVSLSLTKAEITARTFAERDSLTGLLNRRLAIERLDELAVDAGQPFAVLMVDIDGFKSVNDSEGHLAGDAILETVARVLERFTGEGGIAGRYGGEEFIVVLPGATLADGVVLAEGAREAVARESPVTVSIGCAARAGGERAADVVRRADTLLLQAKRSGKDVVVGAPLAAAA